MADTKQATPDECMRIGCGLPAAHLVHNRPSIGEYPIINYHDFVASRSGPHRQAAETICRQLPNRDNELNRVGAIEKILFEFFPASRSGPDRTTQEPREWLIAKRGAAGQWINENTDAPIMWTHDEVLAYLAEAGPDRGQQDAPLDDIIETLISEVAEHYEFDEDTNVTVLEGALRSACDAGWRAKAAREGQAPKGDRDDSIYRHRQTGRVG